MGRAPPGPRGSTVPLSRGGDVAIPMDPEGETTASVGLDGRVSNQRGLFSRLNA